MIKFSKLNEYKGFDKDLHNGIQNSYAWCMSELGDYIYVGTVRDLLYSAHSIILENQIKLPASASIEERYLDLSAEIWRYKKDNSSCWERVYKSPQDNRVFGFRFMINYKPLLGREALYAAGIAGKTKILKSTNGVSWIEVDTSNLRGSSSRSMVAFNNKLYVSTIDEALGGNTPLLYASEDPEFYKFTEIFPEGIKLEKGKNPTGGITNLAVFNNRLYACVSKDSGIEVWRTNSSKVQANDWTLVANNGFGDLANVSVLAVGVYKNHLYVSATKKLSSALLLPQGFDLIRINKNDRWQLVAGGKAYIPAKTVNGSRGESISGFKTGFDNHFNLYGWQIQEYKNTLFISTFDHSSNIQTLKEILLLNRDLFTENLGQSLVNLLLIFYNILLFVFKAVDFPYGFDLITSNDGINFTKTVTNGLGEDTSYGGRMLFVDRCNDLYLGTADPYLGCDVWNISVKNKSSLSDDCSEEQNDDFMQILYYLYDLILRLYYKIIGNDNEQNTELLNLFNQLQNNKNLINALQKLADKFEAAYLNNSMDKLLFSLAEDFDPNISHNFLYKNNISNNDLIEYISNLLINSVDNIGLEQSMLKVINKIMTKFK